MCFISYGFRESQLEKTILRHLLETRGIQVSEAGGELAPAQNAFCVKICSKIVTSQFCIVLVNNDTAENRELPNANVHMEYGLMLGFNKYVIPFQRADQKLPFNIAGLDTIKYTDDDFERRASAAIDEAIRKTRQAIVTQVPFDQELETFLLAKNTIVVRIDNPGDKSLFELGNAFKFNLLVDFAGTTYIYLGNFTALRPQTILWRLQMLDQFLEDRSTGAVALRETTGATPPAQMTILRTILNQVQFWVVVTSDSDKASIVKTLSEAPLRRPWSVFSIQDVKTHLEGLGPAIG